MAWSLEEKLLVVGTQDGTVAVWDMEEHQAIHILTGHTGEARHWLRIAFFLVSQVHQSFPRSPPLPIVCIKTLALILHLLVITTQQNTPTHSSFKQ